MTGQRPHRDQQLLATVASATRALDTQWAALIAAQRTVVAEMATAARRRRRPTEASRAALADFTAALARFDTHAHALAERWAAADLAAAYRTGAEAALARAVLTPHRERPAFHWSASHQRVLADVTASLYPVLVQRVTETVRRAQAFVRAVQAAARSPAAARTEDLAAEHRLETVVYANDRHHPVRAWAHAALTAQAVMAANAGALTATHQDLGARWVQVIDGPECGWTSHPELDRAHDTLRSVEQAAAWPIAHPGCLRQFIPRPDLNDDPTIEEGQSL
ncbi:hypothetical protein [Streptomyces sp. NPDC001404]|uniref:hypothetical protein n=1 Tax=Streptomyces sp. NPDC001404 TaxID=3364571 RepID=UPI0036801E79